MPTTLEAMEQIEVSQDEKSVGISRIASDFFDQLDNSSARIPSTGIGTSVEEPTQGVPRPGTSISLSTSGNVTTVPFANQARNPLSNPSTAEFPLG
ncbi:hypothetical protein QQX98_009434 [Neonectria punicea]|uniref:Uncharacterized protein n=1 Tax=Neonectria punicea TaxID=979145 RepID=A0ABR1GSF6_9HYPO